MKILPCVYRIWNEKTGKYYIGSALNYLMRWKNHRNSLRLGKHRNKHLQNAWNKDGEKLFIFEVLEIYSNKEVMLEREQLLIDVAVMINRDNLYNINLSTKKGGFHNRKHTDETRRRMSEKRMGVSLTKCEKNPNAKLNYENVKEIRVLYSTRKFSFKDLAKIYGVTYQTISQIIKNKIWKND